ncbi:hypothetical protein HFP51_10125 [Parasphingopyxis sp. CP4]|uniref:hypothetical protein n=1 Tax=Parasphingopyxis sp. CP4 TaxID=2724527 RepID=UPI0015A30770|nr:hypothetical protein [Parasphingopyxis sp. CP4]QLC22506.1 hypothetical protein HFP51_10125 [Parasphingopyxis sp. CP4]
MGKMRHLLLHVGHGKTGSSYLQSSLALSQEGLDEIGLCYPFHRSFDAARRGFVTSGNREILWSAIETSDPEALFGPHDTALISGEQLHRELLPRKDAFFAFVNNAQITKVSLLLFIRDPVEDACSGYQQAVKRGGYTGTIEDFFSQYERPKTVSDFLEAFTDKPATATTVRNYSRSSDVLGDLETFLGNVALTMPPIDRINRRLTPAELAIQSSFNKHLGPSGNLVADKLCTELPDVCAEVTAPSEDVQRAMLDRNRDVIMAVNRRIDADQHYSFDTIEPASDESLSLTLEQIQVIAKSLAPKIRMR